MKYYHYREIARFVNSEIIPMKMEEEGVAWWYYI
jgi:histone-lysine N-methyltransferase SETD3